MYKLNETTMTAHVHWQFEIPTPVEGEDGRGSQLNGAHADDAQWNTVMTHDELNWAGGSVYRLDSGRFLVGATSTLNGHDVGQRDEIALRRVALARLARGHVEPRESRSAGPKEDHSQGDREANP